MLEKLRKSLFLLIVLLLGICGAGAFYVSRASAESAVQAATVSLQLQPADFAWPAEEILDGAALARTIRAEMAQMESRIVIRLAVAMGVMMTLMTTIILGATAYLVR